MCHIHNNTKPTEVAASGADTTGGTTRLDYHNLLYLHIFKYICTHSPRLGGIYSLPFSNYEHRLNAGQRTGPPPRRSFP